MPMASNFALLRPGKCEMAAGSLWLQRRTVKICLDKSTGKQGNGHAASLQTVLQSQGKGI